MRSCSALLAALLFLPSVALAGEPNKAPKPWRGIDVTGMDTSKPPADDFYQYANGKWLARTEIPSDRPAVYLFTILEDRNRELLHAIAEEAAKNQSPADHTTALVGAFFRSGMDEARVEAAGAKPLQSEIEQIAAIKNAKDLLPALARLHLTHTLAGFAFAASPDSKNSKRMIGTFYQGGLGLPDRDYYLKDDDKLKSIRAAYVAHVQKMLELLGEKPEEAAKQAQTVLAMETRLAKASRPRVDLRDPHLNYHLMTVAEMDQETPGVSWKPYFEGLGLASLNELNVGQPAFLKELGKMAAEIPVAEWQTYLRWHLLDNYADALSAPFVDEDFHFKGTILAGTPRNRPRWERVIEMEDHLLGEALGRLYVARAFPPEAKARAEKLVQNVKATLRERLATLDWMSPETREQAVKKCDAIAVKIGYPNKWRDYSNLTLDGDTFAENVLKASRFAMQYELAKIGKPTNRDEWRMSPPTVNAYYSPLNNEIVFPAGILQPPFFDPQADDAVNYGAMGVVIGHELTHGFDDQGRKFDAEGNLRDWWTPEDGRRYKERATRLASQYSGYVALDDLHLNGQLTLGENIADLGGLKISYIALHKALKEKPQGKIDGFTPEQRFFLSFAQIWRCEMRPEALRRMVMTNPHSPPRFRVLGPIYNTPEFFEAFNVTPDKAKGKLNPTPVQIW